MFSSTGFTWLVEGSGWSRVLGSCHSHCLLSVIGTFDLGVKTVPAEITRTNRHDVDRCGPLRSHPAHREKDLRFAAGSDDTEKAVRNPGRTSVRSFE
jgi:hypothetical protein